MEKQKTSVRYSPEVRSRAVRMVLTNVGGARPLIGDMAPPTIARLAEHELVVGMKDSAQLSHVQDVVFRTRGNDFRVLCGIEYHLVAVLLIGAWLTRAIKRR